MVQLPEIGLGTACLLQTSLPEFIEVAARHHFRRISVRPYAFAEALRHGHSENSLRRLLSDTGIEVTMIDALTSGLPGIPDPDSLDPSVRATMPPDVLQPQGRASCLHAASALGARMLNVVAYRGNVVPIEQMAESVSEICREAATLGIQVVLEFVPESGIPDLGHALQVWRACNEPNCRLVLDVFHLGRTGGTLDDICRIPPGTIAAMQISDWKPGKGEHVPFGGRLMPGDGHLPLRELVTAGLENNPAATVDIEVLNKALTRLSADEAARRLAAAGIAWHESLNPVEP